MMKIVELRSSAIFQNEIRSEDGLEMETDKDESKERDLLVQFKAITNIIKNVL